MKSDKVKDAAILNDPAFYFGNSIIKRFKFLQNESEIYNSEQRESIGNMVISEKVLNIPIE